jgi:hypothetical protein
MYGRSREYKSLADDDTKIYWQYDRRKGWLKPWKITLVADDKKGLSYHDIGLVLSHCRHYRFLTVEVAIDFTPCAGRQEIRSPARNLWKESTPARTKKVPGRLLRNQKLTNSCVVIGRRRKELAEASGGRTHRRHREMPPAGFEDRDDHRIACASVNIQLNKFVPCRRAPARHSGGRL